MTTPKKALNIRLNAVSNLALTGDHVEDPKLDISDVGLAVRSSEDNGEDVFGIVGDHLSRRIVEDARHGATDIDQVRQASASKRS